MVTAPGVAPVRYCPATYRIRVAGRLGLHWSERLQGMSVSVTEEEDGRAFTEIRGELPDQAALMGVLESLYNCGVPLLHAECVEAVPGTIRKAIQQDASQTKDPERRQGKSPEEQQG